MIEYLLPVKKVWGSILWLVYLFFMNYFQLQVQHLLSAAFAALIIRCKCGTFMTFFYMFNKRICSVKL